jgi:hypothetical protein
MVKRDSCLQSLDFFWKEIINNIPAPFKFSSNYYVDHGSDEWCKVLGVTREERSFSIAFKFSFPSFPFYYKTCVAIEVRENSPHMWKGDRYMKTQYVTLGDLSSDSYHAIQGKDDITYVLKEANARYIYDNTAKIGFELLNALYTTPSLGRPKVL